MVLLAAVPAAADAQRVTSSLSAGVVSVRYADAATISAMTLSPILTFSTTRAASGVGATFSRAGAGNWSAQGILVGSLHSNISASGWFGEIGGIAGGSTHADGARTGQLLASARAYHAGTAITLWTGVGAGAMWDGVGWNVVRQGELGLSARGERATVVATLLPTSAADTLRYADARIALELAGGVVTYRASLGGRVGSALVVQGSDDRVWGDVGVTAWLGERLALVAGAGTYPVDLTQGFPSGRFVSVALRLGGSRPVALRRPTGEDAARRESAHAGMQRFEARRLASGRTRIRVRAHAARRVEFTGDPTTWVPVALRRDDDGWWSLELDVAPGIHEVNVRIDGGAWVVPPGLAVIVDEFGGRTGRLVIP